MATNRVLRSALLKKLGVTPQRLSQRVAQIKRLYGPMTTEEGTYVLAHREGLDLTKYLDPKTVDRIRGMLPASGSASFSSQRPRVVVKRTRPARPIRIAPAMELIDAMIPGEVAQDASRMAMIYPKMYVFENSLRRVVETFLQSAHGKDWWESCAPKDVKNRVTDRKAKEGKTPWHGKRGRSPIHYSDFGDLRKIITGNWEDFAAFFPNQHWITQRLDELEPPRNVIAHNNPLSAQDQSRIDLYFNDWVALLNDRRDVIP